MKMVRYFKNAEMQFQQYKIFKNHYIRTLKPIKKITRMNKFKTRLNGNMDWNFENSVKEIPKVQVLADIALKINPISATDTNYERTISLQRFIAQDRFQMSKPNLLNARLTHQQNKYYEIEKISK